jgi:hypothetical protein
MFEKHVTVIKNETSHARDYGKCYMFYDREEEMWIL